MSQYRTARPLSYGELMVCVSFTVIVVVLALVPYMSPTSSNHLSRSSFRVEATSFDNVSVTIDVYFALRAKRTSIDESTSQPGLPDLFWKDVKQRLEEVVRATVARQELGELTEGLVLDHQVGSALKAAFLEKGFDLTGTVEVTEIQVVLTAAK